MTARAIAKLTADIAQRDRQIETQAQTITRQNVRIGKDAQRIAGLEAAYRRQADKLGRTLKGAHIFKGQNNG